ncbi:MAG: polysaccharide pyruvyl transferase family protein [Terriglobia bacterium]
MNRRDFIVRSATSAAAVVACNATPAVFAAATARPPVILLRGSWQSVNIGDIGHTPGALDLIGRYCPEARVILWPSEGALDHGVKDFLSRDFPRLRIAPGTVKNGNPTTPALKAAWAEADFMLHGSGSGFGARAQLAAWYRATGKPYGVFGTSVDPISGIGPGLEAEGGTLDELRARIAKLPPDHLDKETRWVINRSAFMFCRDTISLDYLKAQGVHPPILEFGPDSQFGMVQSDDARGDAYREKHALEEGKFICVVPRSRYTPYWQIRHTKMSASDRIKDAIDNRTVEKDSAKLRNMMIAYVRNTGNKVMTCPEMTDEIELAKKVLVDPLPADVRNKVVWRDTFWLPDEAAAIYSKAQAVVSTECHSPIISIAHGTPAFYVRQPTDTCKGQMYPDIGLGNWLFEIDEIDGRLLWARLKVIIDNPTTARTQIKTAMTRVDRLQRHMTKTLCNALSRRA